MSPIRNVKSSSEHTCGICLEEVEGPLRTSCCAQSICQSCFGTHRAVGEEPTCPFCRCCSNYSAREWQDGSQALNGVWDVQVVETSALGTSRHEVSLSVHDGWGMYNVTSCYLGGSTWGDLNMCGTPSGKSFTASQKVVDLPPWLSDCSIDEHSGVHGRFNGKDRAVFEVTLNVSNPKGDTMEIVHEARMTRRTRRSTLSL